MTDSHFGLDEDEYLRLVRSTDSVIHCAASLNRKSEKSCLNVNLRGTLEVIQLAMRARDDHGLRRFSHVSTVAVAGQRANEVVEEDTAIDWNRSDYDPYARTKKFCEHMIRQLLPNVPRTIFRPSIVLGDSRRPETNQFDMVRAFVFLAGLPALPFRANDRIDIVPVDYVADAIATLHRKANPAHEIYHLSSGTDSETFSQLTDALAKAPGKRGPVFMPGLERPSSKMVNALAGRAGKIGGLATLLKVFLAVSGLEYGLRQPARRRGNGPRDPRRFRSIVTPCCVSAARIIFSTSTAIGLRTSRGPAHRKKPAQRKDKSHDGLSCSRPGSAA